jgi:hypothetical protein
MRLYLIRAETGVGVEFGVRYKWWCRRESWCSNGVVTVDDGDNDNDSDRSERGCSCVQVYDIYIRVCSCGVTVCAGL